MKMLADISGPLVEGLGSAIIGGTFASVSVYYQQRNRRQDKVDSKVIDFTAARVSDTAAALDAWQKIVAANNLQLQTVQAELVAMRHNHETCEARNLELAAIVQELSRQVLKLQTGEDK